MVYIDKQSEISQIIYDINKLFQDYESGVIFLARLKTEVIEYIIKAMDL